MRIARIAAAVTLAAFGVCVRAAAQEQTKTTVTGTLARVMAIGGESTGWVIQVDPEITIDGKSVHSIEITYKDAQKLAKLENKRVKAAGKLAHHHGVETGDRPVLEISSIQESKTK